MRKIRLDLDALTVDSFSTSGSGEAKGTVLGHGKVQTEQVECATRDFCGSTLCNTGESQCQYCPTRFTDCDTCVTCYESCGDTYCGTCESYCC
jgi:hypothetical protein